MRPSTCVRLPSSSNSCQARGVGSWPSMSPLTSTPTPVSHACAKQYGAQRFCGGLCLRHEDVQTEPRVLLLGGWYGYLCKSHCYGM
jgi:hypothetical protein